MSHRSAGEADPIRPPPPFLPVPDPATPPGPPPDPDNPTIPVPNALLDRPHTEHLPANREEYRSVTHRSADDSARRALTSLVSDPDALPPFHLPAASSRHPVVVAAAASPDVFLLDAPVGPVRVLVTADIAEQCAAGKQRVLVFAPNAEFADAVTERLARRGDVVRLLGRGESVEQLPQAVVGRTEHVLAVRDAADRRNRLEQRIAARTDAVASVDALRPLADALHPDEIASVVDASDARRAAVSTRDATLTELAGEDEVAVNTTAELVAELEELKAELAKPVGLFKRLIGSGKPDPVACEKSAAVEAKLAALAAAAAEREGKRTAAEAVLNATRGRLIAEETDRRRAEWDRHTTAHRETLARLGFEDRPDLRDHLTAERADASAELATVIDLPPMLSADARAKLLISVAVFDADPPAEGFDRVVFAAAEAISEAGFFAASVAGRGWVLIGQSGPLLAPRSNRRPLPPPFFCALWNAAHRGLWTPDFTAPTARLRAVPLDCQHTATSEPLTDWPDVELRMFETPAGETELAEVRFPPRTPLADMRRFLAVELDELRLITVGPARWHVTADQLTCCWPAGESASGRAEWIELPGGMKEKVSDPGPAGLTVAVRFDSNQWTRAAAEEWVAAHTGPTPRTAVLPR